jgi:glycosyltransferase involved in cell wall biosynthesis
LLADGGILPNLKKNKLLYIQIPFLFFWGVCTALWLVSTYKIQCMHAHRIFINGFIWALIKKIYKNIQLICTSHGSDLHTLNWWLIDVIKKWTILQCDQVVVVSSFLQHQLDLLMWYTYPAHILSMGVDEEQFHPNYYDAHIKKKYAITWKFLLFVGRLAPEKWIPDLIASMPLILERYPDTVLLIIGDWPLAAELQEMVHDHWLEKNIFFLWAIPNKVLPAYYATADILIAPSKKESFWLVQVESLCSWTPVITYAWLGSTDIVVDWVNGRLLTDQTQISWAVCALFAQTLYTREQIRSSVVEKFSWNTIAHQYALLFQFTKNKYKT